MSMQGFYRCRHSGLLYPADYCKNWGTKYGVGLGPKPVSEILDTDYSMKPVAGPDGVRRFPIGQALCDIDYVERDSDTVKPEDMAILQSDDRNFVRRAEIIREKQKKNRPALVD